MNQPPLPDDAAITELGRRAFRQISGEVAALGERLDDRFAAVVREILACRGRVIVTGLGKSGIVARKLAATLTSTGTPSHFLHPVEAIHGDLGIVGGGDVLVALSRSGNNPEVTQLGAVARHFGMTMIALTGDPESELARVSDLVLPCDVAAEACPLDLTPTTSTTATLVMGDALAVALIRLRGFEARDFAVFHPGGVLGRSLLMTVRELMHTGAELPVVGLETTLREALPEVMGKRLGATCVVDGDGRLAGICVDGDIKRILMNHEDPLGRPLREVMTPDPETVAPEALVVTALRLMEQREAGPITVLIAVDEGHRPVGLLHLHDILRAGIL